MLANGNKRIKATLNQDRQSKLNAIQAATRLSKSQIFSILIDQNYDLLKAGFDLNMKDHQVHKEEVSDENSFRL